MKYQDFTLMVAALSLVLGVLGTFPSCAEASGNPRLQSVEDLVEVGFSHSRVVMVNEAHDGNRRCVRTRLVGVRILPRAHAAGVRHLAMEALDARFAERANRTRRVPPRPGGYLAQEGMRRLIRTALDLGWTLVPYEADTSKAPTFPDAKGIAATNWREQEQAKNLAAVMKTLGPDGRLLVWCGNSHLEKKPIGNWKPMGAQFWKVSGIEPFSIDQTLTLAAEGRGDSRGVQLLETFHEHLKATPGQTLGFLREDWKEGRDREGVDAFIISLHNALE